ncbi:MBL fold hydrolase [Pseudomonas brassicacearum]|uniref:MBL fold metallo-hydrolase n=1 Tax=Pseudomonas brassicacearum TaxID=930166 RepID=UPI00085989C1|nr:MBL fold metallo-hydrolase [Pseudomonas brassicacearum]AOS37382.1 MBL fold hydrolase [Pseudomonas brassicacearum]
MKITLLGTGAALPDPDRAQTGILLTLANGRNFLLDCGEGVTRQMVKANVNPADVECVVFSHLHHDHICNYPFLIISAWMLNRQQRPRLFGPRGTQDFVDHLLENGAFKADFAARSSYPLRQRNIDAVRPIVTEIKPGVIFEDEDIRIEVDHVKHIPNDICECFGVRVVADGKTIVFSGDTAPCESIVRMAKGADLLIHECTFPESFIAHRAKTGVGTYAHTSPTELGQLAARAEVKHLVATHFGHFDSTSPVLKKAAAQHLPVDLMGPDLLDEVARDIRKSYSGPLSLAHDLMRIDL